MTTPRIFIVDDDIEIAKGLANKVLAMKYEVSGIANNSKDALKEIPKSQSNVILLDINFSLAGESERQGIEVARILKQTQTTSIIFITAYDELAGTESLSEGQLPRNSSYHIIKSNIDRILREQQGQVIALKDKNGNPIKENKYDIRYIKGGGDLVEIEFTNGNRYSYSYKLGVFIEKHDLKSLSFIWHVHKSYYINARQIKTIKGDEIYLYGIVEPLKIGGDYKTAVLKKYQELFFMG